MRAHVAAGDADGAVEAAAAAFGESTPARTLNVLREAFSGSSAAREAVGGAPVLLEADGVLDVRRQTVADARDLVLGALRSRADAWAGGSEPGALVVRVGAPRLHSHHAAAAARGRLRRGVEGLLEDLGVAFRGGGVGAVRVDAPAVEAFVERRALRRTRDDLVRASLLRHAALPGGVLLGILVWPKILPFL